MSLQLRLLGLLGLLECTPQVWDLDETAVCIATAWNLPTPAVYVSGLAAAVDATGGHVVEGAGPFSSAYCPSGSREVFIADGAAGSEHCDGTVLAWTRTDSSRITVCHDLAVQSWAADVSEAHSYSASLTMAHEWAHLGGFDWHWERTSMEAQFEGPRIMCSVRACELTEAGQYTGPDLSYACHGGNFTSKRCRAVPLLSAEPEIRRIPSDH